MSTSLLIVFLLALFTDGLGVEQRSANWVSGASGGTDLLLYKGDENKNEAHDESHTLCAYLMTNFIKDFNVTAGHHLDKENNTQHCTKTTDSCYALFQIDPKNKSTIFLGQGCWDSSGSNCQQTQCVAVKKPTTAAIDTMFCCCSGNYCNANASVDYARPTEPTITTFPPYMPLPVQLVLIAALIIVLALIIAIGYILSRIYCTSPKRSNESLHLMEAPPPPPNYDLDTLRIVDDKAIGQGGYGSVYHGSLNEHSVAVKIFSHQNQDFFYNERDIYILPHMDHTSLAKYIGSKERTTEDGKPEYLLVVTYSPLGCLQNYLRDKTLDWNHFSKMALSITCGLAHLHTEIKKADKLKYPIAHRDLTSRNILVKPDLSCMLCDFGFAVCISGSKYFMNGEEHIAEKKSLAEVGTLRYMAPEILDGAVNLRDIESSLKQIDVYALGLVLWEVASRCTDLYQGLPLQDMPDYKLPFEAEIGNSPTMEQMQVLICQKKVRPRFPDIWKSSNPAIRSLKETIEDCWDQDAEARLTTLCVEERIAELKVTWERHKAGTGINSISPTLNTSDVKKSSNSLKKSFDSNIDSFENNDELICPRDRVNSVSECTTETLLSPSDALSNEINNKNSLIKNNPLVTKVTVPLQSFQGRNPCMERNLMQEASDDLAVYGNSLSDRSSKYAADNRIYSYSDGDFNYDQHNNIEDAEHTPNGTAIRCNIPYVQNHVGSGPTIPKKCNTVGNKGSKDYLNVMEKRKGSFNSKKLGITARIRMLLDSYILDHKTTVSNILPEEQQPLKNSGISSPLTPSESYDTQGQTNPVDVSWLVTNGKDVPLCADTKIVMPIEDSLSKISAELSNSTVDPILNGSISTLDASEENDSTNEGTDETKLSDKLKRPTTLPVQSFKDDFGDEIELDLSDSDISKELMNGELSNPDISHDKTVSNIRRKGSGNRQKVVKRVKTPFRINNRFSLHDDTIMSSHDLLSSSGTQVLCSELNSTKFSASVPLNMNTLGSSAQNSCHVPSNQKEKVELNENSKAKPLNGFPLPIKVPVHQAPVQNHLFSLCDI
ncbi:uncharacterized protein LOC129235146 [Uloborus diversus]|uniref:uncharacterized protein LOC129235146 n=1 Tax=Uloborus diversus TaxID=327109 RepID=UPI002409DEA9|nr:uncharacterized protein LOC129235146 [Uloborus diversus]